MKGRKGCKNEYKIQVVPGAAPAFQLSKDNVTDVVHHGRKQPPPNTPLVMFGFPWHFCCQLWKPQTMSLQLISFPKTSCRHLFFRAGRALCAGKYREKEGGGEESHA